MTDQWAAGIGLGGHQLRAPIGKIQHLQSTGVFNQPGDVFCHQPFRADQHINRTMFAVEQLGILGVVRRTDPGNSGGCVIQGVGDLAGRHIDLVAVGQRDNEVGVLDTGPDQDLGVRGVTDHAPDIQAVLQHFQMGGIYIDNRDVVFLLREAVGYR